VRLVIGFMTLSNFRLEKCQPYLGRVRFNNKESRLKGSFFYLENPIKLLTFSFRQRIPQR
ncbi:hypothetical protein AB7Z98_13370, partial [Providencia manganoxydans]|uniref:hypothetical protein n=1 Tax=Providencia manganoxydans TaxID=2923283 RepID=UPI0034E4BA08